MGSLGPRLQNIRDPERRGPGGLTLEGRMGALIKTIANDIEECGNACNAYEKKFVLSKSDKYNLVQLFLILAISESLLELEI